MGLIDETTKATPEVRLGAARTISGLNYYTHVRTELPSGDSFRDANEGVAPVKGTTEKRLVETFIYNPRWECDVAVADSSEDGAAAFIAEEASAIVEAAMQHLAAQFYYGTGNSEKGFPGLLAAVDTSMEVDAGGSANKTSVWAVRWGTKDVRWVVGEDGALTMGPATKERILDADGNPLTAYVQELLAFLGLQVGSTYSVARIKNIDTSSDSSNALDDDLLADLVEKFPAGKDPDLLLMTRRAQKQLKQSRTATNPTGKPAPWPESIDGVAGSIPIQITDGISNDE